MRNTVRLKQNFDEGMLACPRARNGMCDPVLADFDLAEFQS
jgi:hypothetical protein